MKTKGGWVNLFDLQLKMTTWACLLGSGLKLIFHWKAQLLTFFKSSFNPLAEVFISWTTENNDASSAKSIALHCLINHLYRLRIIMDLEQIPAELQHEHWPITNHNQFKLCLLLLKNFDLCFLLLKKSDKMWRRSPGIVSIWK